MRTNFAAMPTTLELDLDVVLLALDGITLWSIRLLWHLWPSFLKSIDVVLEPSWSTVRRGLVDLSRDGRLLGFG